MYRLQLTPDFGFAEAAEAGEYLADLGVSHAYLSPVLEAVPGSRHGYDVTDHSRIRGELGGEESRKVQTPLRVTGQRHRGHALEVEQRRVDLGRAGADAELARDLHQWKVSIEIEYPALS